MRKKSKPRKRHSKSTSPRSAVSADIEMGRRIRLRRAENGISQIALAKTSISVSNRCKNSKRASTGSARRGCSKSLRCSVSTCRFFTMMTASNQTSTACSFSTAFSASDCCAPTPPSKTKRRGETCNSGRDDCGFSALIFVAGSLAQRRHALAR
jgi:hypothetical protein